MYRYEWCYRKLKIWLLSIESKDTRKIGGLAEVPPRIGEELVKRGHEVYLITINNGFIVGNGDFKQIFKTVKKGVEYKAYLYDKPIVKHIVFTGGSLDEKEVYSPKILPAKVMEWSMVMKELIEKSLGSNDIPDIIHGNDWHSYPPLLAAKAILDNRGVKTKYFYHIHLVSNSTLDLDLFYEYTGIDPSTKINGIFGSKSLREYYDESRGGYIERLAALTVDKVITVSRNYVINVVRKIGLDLESKVDYVYNAITWSLEKLINEARMFNPDLSSFLSIEKVFSIERRILRGELLTKLRERIGYCTEIDDEESKKYVHSLTIYPFEGCGIVDSFENDGPLMIMTGRIAKQKGIDILINATDLIVSELPELKILLTPLPVWSERGEIETLVEFSIMFRDNVRVVFGKAPSIYALMHLSANGLLAPSIHEPFGLMALEAMVSGTPVVASKTGGLAETVLDIREKGVLGTGLHVKPGNWRDLAINTVDLAVFMETQYLEPWSSVWKDYIDRLHSSELRKILLSNPNAPELVRKSCLNRALVFNWSSSVNRLLSIYSGG